jgi:hypothetical protein
METIVAEVEALVIKQHSEWAGQRSTEKGFGRFRAERT